MRAALLNLARAERETFGYVTTDTRSRLQNHGVTSTQLEQFFAITDGVR